MIAILSPAKTLDTTSRPDVPGTTTPDFLDEAEELVTRLRSLSQSRLAALMGISEKLAAENYSRFQAWNTSTSLKTAIPAALMFRGDVYRGLQAESWDAKDFAFAQKHLRILSGLYGILRPLDLVQPYRLEMGTKFTSGSPSTLYEFWGDRLADAINAAVAAQKRPVVINLASNEYFKAVSLSALCAHVITPSFKQEKDGELKTVPLFSKQARGSMARYLVLNRVKRPDGLLNFDYDGYRYDPSLSTDEEPVFARAAS